MRFFVAGRKLAYTDFSLSCKEFAPREQTRAALLCLLFTVSGCSSAPDSVTTISVATPFDNPVREKAALDIYASAKQHDTARLLALRAAAGQGQAPQQSPAPLDPALTLALYVIDPSAHESDFVAGYPTDEIGVQLDYGPRFERSGLAPPGFAFPYLFPIKSLSSIAAKGDPVALTKLLQAYAVSKEPIASAYAEEIAHVGTVLPHEMIAAIAKLPPKQQLDATGAIQWCAHRPNVLAVTPANAAETTVQNELHQRFTDCPTPQPHKNPPHRKPKRPKHRKAHKQGKPGKHAASAAKKAPATHGAAAPAQQRVP